MSEPAPEATEPAPQSTPNPQGTPPEPTPEPSPETTPAPQTEPKTIEELPAWAQKRIAELSKADGDERIAAKTLAALQKVLSPDADKDEKPSVEKLTATIQAKDETIRALTLKDALGTAARAAGADEDLLVAVLSHKGSLKELDPSDKDFTKKLDALVKTELDGNPKLRAARAAGQSGSDFSGGPGEGAITQEQFNKMGVTERTNLFQTNPALYRQLAGR